MLFTSLWVIDVVMIEAVIICPVYLFILFDIHFCRRKRCVFTNSYHTLVLSQGLADILSIAAIMSILLPKYFFIGVPLLISLQKYGTAFLISNAGPFTFLVRMFGIFMITCQRFIAVSWPYHKLNKKIEAIHPMILVAVHWLFPGIVYLPAFIMSNAYLVNSDSFILIISESHLKAFSVIVITFFSTLLLPIVFMYLSILRILFENRRVEQNSMSHSPMRHRALRNREFRLAAHVFLLFVMSILVSAYYWLTYFAADDFTVNALNSVRLYYSLLSSNFSYINPLSLLTLDRDVRRRIVSWSCCSKVAGACTKSSERTISS